MAAVKFSDLIGRFPGNASEDSDAVKTYTQVQLNTVEELLGEDFQAETWISGLGHHGLVDKNQRGIAFEGARLPRLFARRDKRLVSIIEVLPMLEPRSGLSLGKPGKTVPRQRAPAKR